MSKNKGIHWDLYEWLKKNHPQTYKKLKNDVSQEVTNCISNGDNYILAQDIVSRLVVSNYQFEKQIAENILHSLAGMELYTIMDVTPNWYYEKTQLQGRDFTQSIYFKGKARGGN